MVAVRWSIVRVQASLYLFVLEVIVSLSLDMLVIALLQVLCFVVIAC